MSHALQPERHVLRREATVGPPDWKPPCSRTIAELLATGPPLSPRQAAILVRDLARAVGALHRAGAAHGALSARTVAVTVRGRARLLDPTESNGDAARAVPHPGKTPDPALVRRDVRGLGDLLLEMVSPLSARGSLAHGPARAPALPPALGRIRGLTLDGGVAGFRSCDALSRALDVYLLASRVGLA